MLRLKWSTSHAVYIPEMDDEHQGIFKALSGLGTVVAGRAGAAEVRKSTDGLIGRIEDHFAHEERLMRAARYPSMRWHKQRHEGVRKQVGQLVQRVRKGDREAAPELIDFLTDWLDGHTRVADMMLASFLRNHRRGMYRVTFRAGTREAGEVEWVDSQGERFEPGK